MVETKYCRVSREGLITSTWGIKLQCQELGLDPWEVMGVKGFADRGNGLHKGTCNLLFILPPVGKFNPN